jgi:uncharacterized alkaline shock family protein YloU
MSLVEAPASTSTTVAPEQRGTLTIKPRVVSRLAMRSLRANTSADRDPAVDVTHFGDDHVELSADLTLPYPDEPISTVLDRLRAQVVRDVERAVGRPVRSVDLTVEKFSTAPSKPRRRVV